jgi:hypothetical protein
LMIGAILWVSGLILLFLIGRHRAATRQALVAARPRSLAEQLRPLVEAARVGTLDLSKRAELERLLIGYWSKRLGLVDQHPADALAEMKRHEEAGPLLRQVEEWLHSPNVDASSVDVAELLAPYHNLPEDEAERILAVGGAR